MRLNKYLAHAGAGTRRQCGDWVKAGMVTVNGQPERNPAYAVTEGDEVTLRGEAVRPEERPVFVLVNKPRGVLTDPSTTSDSAHCTRLLANPELEGYHLQPVGTLGADTAGLLLMTNDAATRERLAEARHALPQVYTLQLERPATTTDLDQFIQDHGPALTLDWVRYLRDDDPSLLTLRVRTATDEAIRAAFADLGYAVVSLDRARMGKLTKRDLPRGFYRFLGEEEVRWLRYFG